MNLIGLTAKLMEDADAQCGEGFRAWLGEVRMASWEDVAGMRRCFPRCWWLEADHFHFSLAPGDAGIRVDVHFGPGLVRLHAIAPAPVTAGQHASVFPA